MKNLSHQLSLHIIRSSMSGYIQPSPSRIPIMTFDMSTAALDALFPVDNHGWVVLDGVPDTEILREAVVGVLEEFPAMAACIKPGWIWSKYVPLINLEPPLGVFDIEEAKPESIPKPLLDFFHTPLDMQKGPLSAFCLVRAKDISFIGVNVHHGACDGRGLRHFMAALAAHYSVLSAGKKPDRPGFRTDRIPNIIYSQYPLGRRMNMILQDLKTLTPLFRAPVPDRIDGTVSGPGTFTPVFFTGEEGKEIKSKSRSLGITINDLFTAALAKTCKRWNRKLDLLHLLLLQDLRPWGVGAPGAIIEDGEWRTVGNIVGGFFIKIKESDMEDPENFRMLVHEKIKAEKESETALAFTSLVILPVNPFPMKPCMTAYRRLDAGWVLQKILRSTTIFSNLGTVEEGQLGFGEARPIHFGFALPYIENAGPLFTAAGVGDSISFVVSHPIAFEADMFIRVFREEVFR